MSFAVEVRAYNRGLRQYAVRFAERSATTGEFENWTSDYAIEKSNNGEKFTVLTASHPRWHGMYAVSVGIGAFGADSDTQYAWNFQSKVVRLAPSNVAFPLTSAR